MLCRGRSLRLLRGLCLRLLRRRTKAMGSTAARPIDDGSTDAVALETVLKLLGVDRPWNRENGHTITNARPITLLMGIDPPPGNPVCERESAESLR